MLFTSQTFTTMNGLLSLSLAALVVLCAIQPVQSQDFDTNAPLTAAVTAQDEFTTLTHPSFSRHQVRVKKTNFCDPTVKCVYLSPTRLNSFQTNVTFYYDGVASILATWT